MKDNILIAKFMELDYSSYTTKYELKYHNSWDWLMPVVQKCFCTGDDTFLWDDVMNAIWTCDIEVVYSVVVEFINQYNKTK